MQPETEPVQGDAGASVGAAIEARATVDWYFGELIEQVVADYSISSEQLVAALASLEREARRRRDQLDERGEAVSTAGAPGEVLVVPVGTFQVLVRACGLSDEEADAVRSVYNRMAGSIARLPETDATAPIVFAAEPSDLH